MIDHTTLSNPGSQAFTGKRVAVVGLGKSGVASLDALAGLTSARLSAWDASLNQLAHVAGMPLDAAGSDTNPGTLADKVLAWRPDMIIPAPGIPEIGPLFNLAEQSGVEILSEIELAWRLRAIDSQGRWAPWLCVTGTNGKTTTVTMLASILAAAGLGGQALGNVGTPAVTHVRTTGKDADSAFALELSSFQLRTTTTMSPQASVCMNISDDHLEWHGSFDAYRQAKARIYERTRAACVYPVGDSLVQHMVDEAHVEEGARAIGITLGIPTVGQIGIVENLIIDRAYHAQRWTQAIPLFDLDDLRHLSPTEHIPPHLLWDAVAACALARSIDISPEHIRQGFLQMHQGKHRIELVETIDSIRYIDDSKATNAHAAYASITGQQPGSVVWIAGGLAKGAQFGDLVKDVQDYVKAVVVIGKDHETWRVALRDTDIPVTYIPEDSLNPMGEAVAASTRYAAPGDTVLLAPACASMDQFVSYADRGEKFAENVKKYARGGGVGE